MNKMMEFSLCLLLFLFYLFHLVVSLYIISITLCILISLEGFIFYGFFCEHHHLPKISQWLLNIKNKIK